MKEQIKENLQAYYYYAHCPNIFSLFHPFSLANGRDVIKKLLFCIYLREEILAVIQ